MSDDDDDDDEEDDDETEYDREFISDEDNVWETVDIHRQMDMQRVEEEASEIRRAVQEANRVRREERASVVTTANLPNSDTDDSVNQDQVGNY